MFSLKTDQVWRHLINPPHCSNPTNPYTQPFELLVGTLGKSITAVALSQETRNTRSFIVVETETRRKKEVQKEKRKRNCKEEEK